MDRNYFSNILQSIVIQEGTSLEILNEKVKPISEALLHMMPHSLFRYRSCEELQIEAFKEDRIYAVTADKYNDPYDTLVRYDIQGIKHYVESFVSCETLEKLKIYFEQGNDFPDIVKQTLSKDLTNELKNQLLLIKDIRSFEEKFEESKKSLLSLIDIYFPILAESIKKFSTMACFCESIQSVIMWSHYAQFHQGFALEYKFRPTLKNVGIFPVIYGDERQDVSMYMAWGFLKMIGINTLNPDILSHLKMALHKSMQWEYEKEWRLVNFSPRDISSNEPSVIHMKPVAIYYGQRISLDNKKRLHEIAKNKGIKEYDMFIDDSSPKYEMLYRVSTF